MPKHIQIRKSEHHDPLSIDILRAKCIFCCTCCIIMLGAIQFYRQLCFVAIKIHNIITNFVLSAKLTGVASEEVVPKEVFFFGGIFS